MTQTLTHEEIISEVERQVRVLLPEFDGEITPASSFEEMDMDSLSRVDLLAALEIAYGVDVPDDEVANVVRVQDLADLVIALRDRT
jgi:acyl carrier protein